MPESTPFHRSLAAQHAALCAINAAKDEGLLNSPVTVTEEFAAAEKDLILLIMRELKPQGGAPRALTADEISALFTFVFAKAAECVTSYGNAQPIKFEPLGMLDGKAPLYANDILTGYFKELHYPTRCAENFVEFFEAQPPGSIDLLLTLMESLKWCFRLGCHIAVERLEKENFRFDAP